MSLINNAIVDVQGFKTEQNEFIPKEIAIMSNNKIFVLLIKPPFPFYNLTKKERIQVSWIERNRGIYWNQGFVPYVNYKNVIGDFLKNKCILTKGYEKVSWIKDMFNNYNVHNLEDRQCPNLESLRSKYSTSTDILSCIYHEHICALKNVLYLNKWCKENNI